MNEQVRAPFLKRLVRSEPHLYSLSARARMFVTRNLRAREERALMREHRALFAFQGEEAERSRELAEQGFTVLPGRFPVDLVDRVFAAADAAFHRLDLAEDHSYTVRTGQRETLSGLTYDQLAKSEKMISLRDPLVQVPEALEMAYDESILRIVAGALGFVPPSFNAEIVRDFPLDRPRESSNFHRDSDERDSLQAFVYLVDIDDHTGPLVYVPGSNRHDVQSCRPRLAIDLGIAGFDGRVSDEEIERHYPRDTWTVLAVPRGSVAILHGNGFHKGPAWPEYGNPENRPRTAIKLNFRGRDLRPRRRPPGHNRIPREAYEQLTPLQRLVTKSAPA